MEAAKETKFGTHVA